MKNYDKKKNRHIFSIGMEIVHIIGQCHKTLRRPKILLKSMKISKNYKEESDKRYFLPVDVQYLQKLYELHNDLPFLPQTMKNEKVKKLVANLHDKTECYIYKKFKTGIKSWISFKKS